MEVQILLLQLLDLVGLLDQLLMLGLQVCHGGAEEEEEEEAEGGHGVGRCGAAGFCPSV